MLMKERAKTKGRQHIEMLVSEDNSYIANQSPDPTLNFSATLGSFDTSQDHLGKRDSNLKDK